MRVARRLAAGTMAAVALAGCAFLGPPEAKPADPGLENLTPVPAGPVVEVASGTAADTTWLVAAYLDETGDLCIAEIISGSWSGSSCGEPVGVPMVGPISMSPSVGDDGLLLVVGLGPDARRLRVEAPGGSVDVEAVSLAPLGIDRLAAAVHLPAGGHPTAATALDGDGAELQRVELGPVP